MLELRLGLERNTHVVRRLLITRGVIELAADYKSPTIY